MKSFKKRDLPVKKSPYGVLLCGIIILCCQRDFSTDSRYGAARNATAIVGAIRWDAYHGDLGAPGLAVEKALGPKQWHYRLPFYAHVVNDSTVQVRANSQAIMDQEIEYASAAGLDYWAFVSYAEHDPMSLGLQLYLASSKKSKMKFCLILGASALGPPSQWPSQMNRYVNYFRHPDYQTVLGDRPLVFLFNPRQWENGTPFGSWDRCREAFDEFRKSALRAGLGAPYFVVQVFSANDGKLYADRLGFDAAGAYATSGGGVKAPYAELASYSERWWDSVRASGCKLVPLVMSGWDRRPRVIHPMPWETWQKPGVGLDNYYETPTPAELATHLQHALEWNTRNPEIAESNAILIYAWNENDEGGWLTPTLMDGSLRLDALAALLRLRF